MNVFLVLASILCSRKDRKEIDLEALAQSVPKEKSLSSDHDDEKQGSVGDGRNSTRADGTVQEEVEETEDPADEDDEPNGDITFASRIRRLLHNAKNFVLERDGDDEGDSVHDAIYRWLPIFSGIVIPFSILLEIPGLTEHWYIVTDNNAIVNTKKNSTLLDAGMGISMAAALIANIALIFRFLERKVRTSTLIAIVALTLHDIINIAAVTIFGVLHRHNDGFTFGQSYWFTVCSTIASTAVNVSLILDFIWTPEFAWSSSGLTKKQRSLVIIVMVLLCWIALGALINSLLMNLDFIDGMYFTVVTITTVGYGDIYPKTTASRIFTAFHSTIGIVNLGLAVNLCNQTVVEGFQDTYKRHITALIEWRKEHKAHRKEMHAREAAIKRKLEEAGLPVYVEDEDEENTHQQQLFHHGHQHNHHHHLHRPHFHKRVRLNVEALSAQQRADATREALQSLQSMNRQATMAESRSTRISFRELIDSKFTENLQRDSFIKLTIVWSTFLGFWLVGAAIFMATEDWSYGMSIWFCFETFTTIGYGERTPSTPAGRSVFVVWALNGIGTMSILLSVLNEVSNSNYEEILARRDKNPISVKPPGRSDSDWASSHLPGRIHDDDVLLSPHIDSPGVKKRDRPWSSLPDLVHHDEDPSQEPLDSESEPDGEDSEPGPSALRRVSEGARVEIVASQSHLPKGRTQ